MAGPHLAAASGEMAPAALRSGAKQARLASYSRWRRWHAVSPGRGAVAPAAAAGLAAEAGAEAADAGPAGAREAARSLAARAFAALSAGATLVARGVTCVADAAPAGGLSDRWMRPCSSFHWYIFCAGALPAAQRSATATPACKIDSMCFTLLNPRT